MGRFNNEVDYMAMDAAMSGVYIMLVAPHGSVGSLRANGAIRAPGSVGSVLALLSQQSQSRDLCQPCQ